ncbi:MAG TPA: FecR domain-containing protein [Campylobacterales bacterium]|nr:FecR domain-containing protein [Campylobacterales bacterium]
MKSLAIIAFTSSILFAAEPVGIFKSVSGGVELMRADKTTVTPKAGDRFFESDMIKTAPKASAGVIFNDNTLVSIGQNSQFVVKEYIFKPSEKQGSFTGRLDKGTMACMTGLIAKMNPNAMKLESKTATLGIRGTYFVVEAE